MKKLYLFLLAVACILPASAKDVKGIEIKKLNGEALHIANTAVKSMTFADDNAILTSTTGETIEIPCSQIASVSPVQNIASEYTVSYRGTTAAVVNPYAFSGVTTDIDGCYVTTTNTNEAEELTFGLDGSTADGSYTYVGTYKCTMRLNGVSITSNRGAAIDVKCGKRIAVVLVEGTENSLTDFCRGRTEGCPLLQGTSRV